MKLLLLIFIFATIFANSEPHKKVCFTIDDMPFVTYGVNDTTYQKVLFDKITQSLVKNGIPAIGFVNEGKLLENDFEIGFRRNLIEKWVGSDLEIGNHSYSHFDYHNTDFKIYTDDIIKGELSISQILNKYGKKLKYFRHPYLRVGNNKERADSLDRFLLENNYTTAPITIDNEDYLFAFSYHKANIDGDSTLMSQIGSDYIEYIEKKILYFESKSLELFGRDINHIMLLHASLLNSDYMDQVIAVFQNHDYDFVSIDEALKDEAYNTPITYYSDWGISWIDRWALSAGKKSDFFKDEPRCPEYIYKMTK